MNTRYTCGCGQPISTRRWDIGYKLCLECGEAHARTVKHCIVPLHKSNYIPITDLRDLKGINNKGGMYR
jgi:hypothetical protein